MPAPFAASGRDRRGSAQHGLPDSHAAADPECSLTARDSNSLRSLAKALEVGDHCLDCRDGLGYVFLSWNFAFVHQHVSAAKVFLVPRPRVTNADSVSHEIVPELPQARLREGVRAKNQMGSEPSQIACCKPRRRSHRAPASQMLPVRVQRQGRARVVAGGSCFVEDSAVRQGFPRQGGAR